MKRYNKIVSYIILCLMLAGCGTSEENSNVSQDVGVETEETAYLGNAEVLEDFKNETAEKPAEEVEEPEEEYIDEQESESVSITEEQIDCLQSWLDEYRPPLKGAESEILELQGNLSLNMDESCYPELSERLRQYLEQERGYWDYDSDRVIVHRADRQALSFLEKKSGEGFCVKGYNFDPETGKDIELSSVVTDIDSLSAVIEAQLVKSYPDIQLGDNPVERIKQLCNDRTTSAWTISYHGLCFYFSSEALASQKGELLHTVITFSDMPELFDEKYRQIPAAYAIELEEDIPFLYDIDVDGSSDLIKVFFYPDTYQKGIITYHDDEQDDTGLQVNDMTCSGKYEGWTCYEIYRRVYLLHVAENKNYILFYERGELDCTGEYGVYAVENGNLKYLGSHRIYLDDYMGRITDPSAVRLKNVGEPLMSGFFLTETEYFVNETGFLETDNTIYYYLDSGREIKTLIELKVPIVDPYTGKELESDVTLLPDTFMEPLRTDLYTWCDFVLEDGRVCRIVFDESMKDSQRGIPTYEGKDLVGECISAYYSEIKLRREYSW